jgi:hypothetical protein
VDDHRTYEQVEGMLRWCQNFSSSSEPQPIQMDGTQTFVEPDEMDESSLSSPVEEGDLHDARNTSFSRGSLTLDSGGDDGGMVEAARASVSSMSLSMNLDESPLAPNRDHRSSRMSSIGGGVSLYDSSGHLTARDMGVRTNSLCGLCVGDDALDDTANVPPKIAHRLNVYKELLTSERAYVKDLEVMIKAYLVPIRDNKLLNPKEHSLVFSNIEEILKIHIELKSLLEKAHQDSAEKRPSISYSEVFQKMHPYLLAYSKFCTDFSQGQKILATLKSTNPELCVALNKGQLVEECCGLDLSSFLIKPVQRICKYPLFFQDILSHMDAKDKEAYRCMQSATQVVQKLSVDVNKKVFSQENTQKVFEIYNNQLGRSVEDLVIPERKFVVEGDCVLCHPLREPKAHHFFLFNDLLLFVTLQSSGTGQDPRYKVKFHLFLHELIIQSAPKALVVSQRQHTFFIFMKPEKPTHGEGSGSPTAASIPTSKSSYWTSGTPDDYRIQVLHYDEKELGSFQTVLSQNINESRGKYLNLQKRQHNAGSASGATSPRSKSLKGDIARRFSFGSPKQSKDSSANSRKSVAAKQPAPLPLKADSISQATNSNDNGSISTVETAKVSPTYFLFIFDAKIEQKGNL